MAGVASWVDVRCYTVERLQVIKMRLYLSPVLAVPSLLLALAFFSSCSSSSRSEAPVATPVPILVSISPSTGAFNAGSGLGQFTLVATGSGFTPASVVQWEGVTQPTTFISSSKLSATIMPFFPEGKNMDFTVLAVPRGCRPEALPVP